MIPRRKPYFAPKIFFNLVSKFMFLGVNFKQEYISKLENSLKTKLHLPNPLVVASGRVGLQLILEESGLPKRSEIIIPGYTFGELAKLIKSLGFTPVVVDIDPETFEMSSQAVKLSLTKKTGAILATHLLGEPCDIKSFLKIAKKHKLLLIEDCAQSLGATVNGKQVGTFGNVALSSFNIAKPLQGITGGLIFGKNKALIQRIERRVRLPAYNKNYSKETMRGMTGYILTQTPLWYLLMYLFSFKNVQRIFVKFYRSIEPKKSENFSLNPIFAYLVLLNLSSFQKRLLKRRRVRSLYMKYLGSYIKFQKIYKTNKGSVDMLVGTVNKDIYKIRRFLSLYGIDVAIRDEIADDCLKTKNSATEHVFKNAIALPVYEGLKVKDIKYLAGTLKNYLD